MVKQTTIEVIPFHPKHIEVMDIRDLEKDSVFKLEDIYERMETAQRASEQSGTFLYDGRILFCAGFYVLWPGCADGWVVPSRYVAGVPAVYARSVRRYVEVIMKTYEFHRFQSVAVDDIFHGRWMRFLGFQKEGTLRRFSSDKRDFCQYAKVV